MPKAATRLPAATERPSIRAGGGPRSETERAAHSKTTAWPRRHRSVTAHSGRSTRARERESRARFVAVEYWRLGEKPLARLPALSGDRIRLGAYNGSSDILVHSSARESEANSDTSFY